LKKGRPILMEGRLRLDQWDDKQTGQKRSKLGVVLESFQFIDSGKGDGGPGDGSRSRSSAPTQSPPEPAEAGAPAPEEDDVPF